MTDHEQVDISIWERLNPEEGFREEHIRYFEELGIGKLPRMDETFVRKPKERAIKKREYVDKHLGIDLEKGAKLSKWSSNRLEKTRVRWEAGKEDLPVAIEVLCEAISTCHVYLDVPKGDEEVKKLLLESLNLVWKGRISKRKERQVKVSTGKSVYSFKKSRGSVGFPGLDHLPEGTLVEMLKQIETALKLI